LNRKNKFLPAYVKCAGFEKSLFSGLKRFGAVCSVTSRFHSINAEFVWGFHPFPDENIVILKVQQIDGFNGYKINILNRIKGLTGLL